MSPLVVIGLVFTLLAINGLGVFSPIGKLINKDSKTHIKAIPFQNQAYSKSPVKSSSFRPFQTQASSAIVYDVASGTRLVEKQPDAVRPIASLNKLMTALVIMETHSPDEIVTIPELPELDSADQKLGITAGEKFKLIDLTKALLIYSANDVANALAIYDSGSIEAFAQKMNVKAKTWNLSESHYVNPSGLDEAGQVSSANNVLTLTTILLQNRIFSEITKSRSDKISSTSGKTYTLTTTNKILGQGGVIGVKTGFTLNAGECLVTLSQRNSQRLITVVLDSPDRFQESKSMIDWAFNNYTWQ